MGVTYCLCNNSYLLSFFFQFAYTCVVIVPLSVVLRQCQSLTRQNNKMTKSLCGIFIFRSFVDELEHCIGSGAAQERPILLSALFLLSTIVNGMSLDLFKQISHINFCMRLLVHSFLNKIILFIHSKIY